MKMNYDSFREMENLVCGFCDDEVLLCNYEEDDLVETYISQIFTYYIQERITQDILANGYDEDLIDLIGNVDVHLPKELIDYYRDAVDLSEYPIPKEKVMPPLKLNKHLVQKMIMENPDWFEDGSCWLSRADLEEKINQTIQKKARESNRIFYKSNLSSSTLTAMVNNGVFERKFSEINHCYSYRPILPTNN